METLKSIGNSLKNNVIGTLAGAGAGYYAAKKWGKIENKWILGGLTLVGAVIGASIEYKIKARTVKPALAAAKK